MNIISITSIICITLFGLFGLFAVFTKHGNRKANKLLGFFFLLWAFDFLDGLLLFNGFYLEHPEFALWGESFVFLYGPLLYFYTLHIAKRNTHFTWKSFLHLIPFFSLHKCNSRIQWMNYRWGSTRLVDEYWIGSAMRRPASHL